MKVEFFTIVYNGMPWIRGQAEFFRKLKGVDWRWHVVEGLAEHVQDTAWCKEAGGRISDFEIRNSNLSTDGTREFLDELKKEFGDKFLLYRPPGSKPWQGKKAMIDSFLGVLPVECLLWQLDVDEFWRPKQVQEIGREFQKRPELTAAWFDCDYFFGWDRCSSRPGVFGNFREYEWLRVWRFQKGDVWESHEPPSLLREVESRREAQKQRAGGENSLGQGRVCGGQGGKRKENIGRINPLLQEETRSKGWKFQHYALTDRAQMEFKETYYGHQGLTAGLNRLDELGRSAPLARRLFPHIRDKEIGTARTLRTFWKNLTEPLQPGARAEDARKGGTAPMAQIDFRGKVRFTFEERKAGQPASILIIRSDRIGDQILFLPFLASLRKQLPETQIHLAVPEDVAPIYRLWGEVDRLHTFRREEGHRSAGYRKKILREMPGRFDWMILPAFNGEKLSHKLADGIRAKRKVGFAGEFRGVKARHRAKYENILGEKVAVPNPDLHELEKYRLLLKHLGLKPEIGLPKIEIGRDDWPQSSDKKRSFPRIILAAGTVNPIKEYPHWSGVVAALNDKISPEWILIGGAEEKIPETLLRVFPAERMRDLRGKTSLDELAGEIAAADLFLGVDTGPAHLALALGKPAVVVLGGGDYGRFFPYGNARVVTHRMDCFHCHWECRYDRALCLHDIPPLAVAASALRALGQHSCS